jgi:hypothetical protein
MPWYWRSFMPDYNRLGLIAEMHQLLNVVAPVDPEIATRRLHVLIDRYGRGEVRAALVAVAPDEVAELGHEWHRPG